MTLNESGHEFQEAFMPTLRMTLLTAFCFHVGNVRGEDEVPIPERYFTFEALKARILGGPDSISTLDKLLYFAVLAVALEIFNHISIRLGDWIHAKHLPVRGHHLDVLTKKDKIFLLWNKISNGLFVLVCFMYINWDENFLWDPSQMTVTNTAFPFPIFFIVYDFFYTLGHMFYIKKGFILLYTSIIIVSKHQDALNVHPLEYAFGQYNALWTMFLMCRFMHLHIVGANLIMFATNAASCFNHQRYDIKIPFLFGINLYESKCHDLHHRIPNVNFGQYIMLWDWVFGSHRPYSQHEKDPIDAMNQLDHRTGQTLAFVKEQKKQA